MCCTIRFLFVLLLSILGAPTARYYNVQYNVQYNLTALLIMNSHHTGDLLVFCFPTVLCMNMLYKHLCSIPYIVRYISLAHIEC